MKDEDEILEANAIDAAVLFFRSSKIKRLLSLGNHICSDVPAPEMGSGAGDSDDDTATQGRL